MASLGPSALLHREKLVERLLKPAVQQVFKALERNHAAPRRRRQFVRQMKTVDGVKKKQRADALVKIVAVPAKGVQFGAGGEQLLAGTRRANGVERLVADLRIRRGDDFDERAGHASEMIGFRAMDDYLPPCASNSTRPARTSVAVRAAQGQRQLRGEQAVFHADVKTAAVQFAGQIALAVRQPGKRLAQAAPCSAGGHLLAEQLHHRRRQHVHAEETEIMAGAQSGHDEALLGHGGRGLLQHFGNQVKPLAFSASRPPATP